MTSSTDRESAPVASPDQKGFPQAQALTWGIAAALVAGVLLAPALLYPYGRDQAVFAYLGRVVAEGGMPYRDAWDLKPPGIYLAYGALSRLCPSPAAMMLAVHLADVALAMLTGVLLVVLGRRFGRPEVGCAAAAWYGALLLQGGYWGLAQGEAWANPLMLGAALLCFTPDERQRRGALLGAGLLAGCAGLLKFTAALPLAPVLALSLWTARSTRGRDLFLFSAGLSAPFVLAGAWLVNGGAWRDYVDIQQGFVAAYARLTMSGPLAHLGRAGSHTLAWMAQIWLPVLLAVTAACLGRQRREPLLRLAAAMLGCGLLAAWVQDKYFGYHWHTALPGLVLLAGLGGAEAAARCRLSSRQGAASAMAVAVLWALAVNWGYYRDAMGLTTGRINREQWLARFGRPGRGDHSFLADMWVARAVKATTAPDDKILVWGFEPSIYLFAERRSPTRYFFNVPVIVPFTPERWRAELLRDLRRDPPRLFIVARNDAIPWATGLTADSADQLGKWPELNEWVRSGYAFEQQIEDFAIYRRRPDTSRIVTPLPSIRLQTADGKSK